jgi:two-component system LytT family response regulator
VTIRTLIVDDEPLARARIRALLQGEPDLTVVGECGDGGDAVAVLRAQQPDLVFLDVQMPVLDGFGVVEAIGPERLPALIFVTAHDRYALRAFEVHALDYLLKPFDRERFRQAVARARDRLARTDREAAGRQLLALLEEVRAARQAPQRLVIKEDGRVFFIRLDDVDWIEAAGNYVRLHVGGAVHLLRETMTALEGRLPGEKFLRIHRSTIVQIDRIRELEPWFHGDYRVQLRDGTALTLSRGYRQKLQERLGNLL